MTWRDRFRRIIGGVIAEVGAADMKKLRKALRQAWPYIWYEAQLALPGVVF